MFVNAIELADRFTRPMHTISRNFASVTPVPGAATLFFVNADGWVLTCAHVARVIMAGDVVKATYDGYRTKRSAIISAGGSEVHLASLDQEYGYNSYSMIELYNSFVNCVDGQLDMDIHVHPSADVALIKFKNYTRLLSDSFPVFAADGSQLKQGKSICRLGFPFPEFRNFEYDAAADQIKWNADPRNATPRFPIDGMVTRLLNDAEGSTVGFELSTPGLKGQSGGPAFDTDGRIWGMQSATGHLYLDFDVDVEVMRPGGPKRIQNSAFLHVGYCVHVDILKDFMRSLGVAFQES
ncbi:MAG: serine protease [Pyrinomonadaceae bacterium]